MYPLKFKTIYKDKIWGGNKIKSLLNKDFSPLENCGETWEISGVAGNISIVENGNLAGKNLQELIETYKEKLLGKAVFERFGLNFPLLIKFIDANDDLSIQVHPDDKLAKKRHQSFGKTEMWYIIQADENAKLISGFNQKINKEIYEEKFNQGKLNEVLNQENVFQDDVFFIPAGRVHTIGKGILLAEIQQTSDITYRIYDFDRKDAHGNERELHVKEALDAIDYQVYDNYKSVFPKKLNEAKKIVECQYFKTNRLLFNQNTKRDYSNLDSFVILICLEGNVKLNYHPQKEKIALQKGESILIPAEIKTMELETNAEFKILETHL